MLRFFLLGGRWGPVPAVLLVVLGAAALGAAGIVLVVTAGGPFSWVGTIEAVVFALIGAALLSVGLVRRGKGPGSEPPPFPPGL